MTKVKQHPAMLGALFSVIAVLLWSGNYVIASGLGDRIPPVSMAFYRWGVAVLVCLPFGLKAVLNEQDLLRKHWRYLLLVSALGIALFNTLVYMAGKTSTAVNMSLISMVSPISILVLSAIFLKERLTWLKGAGVLLVITGISLLLTKGQPLQIFSIRFTQGDILMLIAALSFGVYSVLLKRKPAGISAWAFQLITFAAGLLLLAPFFLWERAASAPIAFTWNLILPILYTGVFASLVAFFLWGKAVTTIGASKTGMVANFMPLLSGILGWLVLGQSITVMHLISGVLILGGVVLSNSSK